MTVDRSGDPPAPEPVLRRVKISIGAERRTHRWNLRALGGAARQENEDANPGTEASKGGTDDSKSPFPDLAENFPDTPI